MNELSFTGYIIMFLLSMDGAAGGDVGGGDVVERTADYDKLIESGLDSKVADKLDQIYKVGQVCVHCSFPRNVQRS